MVASIDLQNPAEAKALLHERTLALVPAARHHAKMLAAFVAERPEITNLSYSAAKTSLLECSEATLPCSSSHRLIHSSHRGSVGHQYVSSKFKL